MLVFLRIQQNFMFGLVIFSLQSDFISPPYLKFSYQEWCFTSKCYDGFILFSLMYFFISFIAIKTFYFHLLLYELFTHVQFSSRNPWITSYFPHTYFFNCTRFIRIFWNQQNNLLQLRSACFLLKPTGFEASVIQDPRSAVGPIFSYSQQLMQSWRNTE